MNYKKFLGAASAALMIVIALPLVLAPDAGAASKYKVLHAFNGKDGGSTPYGGVIFDAAGNLYGTTYEGGAQGLGTVFKLASNADQDWTETVLYSFNGSDGGASYAGLIFDGAGNLYGTTGGGGAHDWGTVFKLVPNADGSWTESVLHSFDGNGDGGFPTAGLIFDAAGNLYGTTQLGGNLRVCGGQGCGVVFELQPGSNGSWTESVLHSFNPNDGYITGGGVIFDTAGNLYGTTFGGGGYNHDSLGTVFKLTPNADGSWKQSVLHVFNGSDGGLSQAGLVFDAAGNLYGTTYLGTVFKLTPNADGKWTVSVLHRFAASAPTAGLIFDAAGNLYSTTSLGGSADDGVAFELSPNQDGSWAYSLLHAFQGKPAINPAFSGLVLGSAGNLYGTTAECGTGCKGVVYQITP